ncbi:MAG: hypothetical protein AB1453_02220 [Chloroflexota bacterium]
MSAQYQSYNAIGFFLLSAFPDRQISSAALPRFNPVYPARRAAGRGCVADNFTQDDTFITYRYARNIARGYGFVYNPGEGVLGTTTPLYTLLLAAIIAWATRLDVVGISQGVTFFSLWLSAFLLYKLGESCGKLRAGFLGLVYLTNPFLPHFGGMQSLFLLFLNFSI